jgi:cobalt-zinc-cadmium resistance protein CzcA
MLLIWGGIAFHNLPIEAYPDVANNYVQVITQWPGQAAEEIEHQVTIPLETVMNAFPTWSTCVPCRCSGFRAS